MSVTQTVEIPANRQLNIDVPCEVPVGPVILTFTPAEQRPVCLTAQEAVDSGLGLGADPHIDPAEAVKRCSGIFNRLGIGFSSDDFLAMRRQDKELEERLDSRGI